MTFDVVLGYEGTAKYTVTADNDLEAVDQAQSRFMDDTKLPSGAKVWADDVEMQEEYE